jgi:hypothetical protein
MNRRSFRRAASLALPALALSASDPAPVPPDAAMAPDAPPVDAPETPDAFVMVRDWPAREAPVSAEVETGIVRELVEIPGFDAPANPTTGDDTPTAYDRARFMRFRAATPTEPAAVVIAMPGIFGGAGSFEPLARSIVRRSLTSATGAVEVWAIDRRSNHLEDRRGLDTAELEREPDAARGYYYGTDTVGGERFAGFVMQEAVPYMSEWGLETHFGDLRAMIERVPASARRGHVFLLGHSLGASMTETFASWVFPDGVRGADLLAGLILVDGAQGETPLTETEYLEGGGGGFMPFDGVPGIRTGNRYIALPLLGVSVYTTAEIVAMAAAFSPDEVRMGDRERDRVLGTLLSVPRMPPMTNEAAFGLGFDDASNGLSFAAVSMGSAVGPMEPYDSLFGATLLRPSDRTVTYTWTDAPDTMPPEHTPVQNLAESWYAGPTNFAEWYFPARLSVDLGACAGLAVPSGDWQEDFGLRCREGATMDAPVLAVAAGLRDVASYERSRMRSGPVGTGRPNAGAARDTDAGYRIVDVTFMTHIDPLTGADTEANVVPEEVLAFVAANVEPGTVAGIDLE